MRHKTNHSTSGFTLLEILIAIFIFTIIAVITTHALHNAINTQAQVEKRTQDFTDLQRAILLLSRDCEQAINRPTINTQGKVETAVTGEPHAITLTRAGLENPDGTLLRSTLQRVRYRLIKTDLVRDSWEALDQTPKSLFRTQVLMHGVESLNFTYLNDKKLFSEQWPEPDGSQHQTMPRAIRMTLTLIGQGQIEQTYIVPDQLNEQK